MVVMPERRISSLVITVIGRRRLGDLLRPLGDGRDLDLKQVLETHRREVLGLRIRGIGQRRHCQAEQCEKNDERQPCAVPETCNEHIRDPHARVTLISPIRCGREDWSFRACLGARTRSGDGVLLAILIGESMPWVDGNLEAGRNDYRGPATSDKEKTVKFRGEGGKTCGFPHVVSCGSRLDRHRCFSSLSNRFAKAARLLGVADDVHFADLVADLGCEFVH